MALAILFGFVAASGALSPPPLSAQTNATVTGRVSDPAQNPLSGAVVRIEPLNRGVLTDQNGEYRLIAVPPGNYTIAAEYLGYTAGSQAVSLAGGGMTTVNLVLQADPIALSGIEVFGQLTRGQAQALNEQRTAANLQYVVNEEQFDRYPDVNAAETVQRLPGVSIARDQGEGRYVQVRGLGQELNSLTMNGVRIPAIGRGAERSVELDLIQSSLIEDITVTKALRPDLDADALGGVVDFQLKKAGFLPEFNVEAGLGLNDQESEINNYGRSITSFNGSASQRFADDRVGALVAGSFHNTERGSIFESWRYYEDEGPDTWRHRTTDYDVGRERIGLVGNFDFQYSPAGELGLTLSWDRFMEDEIRRLVAYDALRGREQRFTGNRTREQYLTFGKLYGEHSFGGAMLDFEGSWAEGREGWPDITEFQWSRPNPILTGLSNADLDALATGSTFAGLDTPLTLDYAYTYPTHVGSTQQTAGVNLTLPFGPGSSTLKFGGKWTQADREYLFTSVRTGPGAGAVSTINGGEFGLPDVRMGDPEIDGLSLAAPLIVPDAKSNASSYQADETILAGYAMATTDWGRRFTTLAGLRVENTSHDYLQYSTGFEGTGDYTTLLPSFHAVVRLNDDAQVRAAVTRGLARPSFSNLVPTESVDEADLEISRGNPGLEPLKAWSYDLMLERYSASLGFLGAGLFYKQIEDPIATQSYTETRNGQSYVVFQPRNGGSATVYGIELSTFQPLSILRVPALRWFAVNANYTWNHSDTDFGGLDAQAYPLPNSPEHTGNVSLTYDNPGLGLSAVIAGNYRSYMWEKFEGGQLHNDIWTGEEFHLDFGLTQQWSEGLATYLQLNNLTNEADTEIEGEPSQSYSRIHERERYSWWATVGLRYSFRRNGR